jgi:hypothetical protein
MKHVIVLEDIITLALAAIIYRTKNDVNQCMRVLESSVKQFNEEINTIINKRQTPKDKSREKAIFKPYLVQD